MSSSVCISSHGRTNSTDAVAAAADCVPVCFRWDAQVRVDKGEMRIGIISDDVKLGDNWCDASKVGHAFFLDTVGICVCLAALCMRCTQFF